MVFFYLVLLDCCCDSVHNHSTWNLLSNGLNYLYKDISNIVWTCSEPNTLRTVLTLAASPVKADLPNEGLMLHANQILYVK